MCRKRSGILRSMMRITSNRDAMKVSRKTVKTILASSRSGQDGFGEDALFSDSMPFSYHILDSTSFSTVVLVPAGRSGKKLIPVSCSILEMSLSDYTHQLRLRLAALPVYAAMVAPHWVLV